MLKNPKILYASVSVIPGLAANSVHVCKMAQSFLNKGYENTFIGIRPHFFSSLDMSLLRRKYGLTRDIELITFPRIRGLKMIYYLYQIKKFVKKYNPDLIYTRSIFLAYKLLNLNKKIVFECHDRLTEEELDKFKTVCNSENLIKIVSKSGVKIIIVTHDLFQAKRLANDILFFHNGKIIEHTKTKIFFKNPKSKEAKDFQKGLLLK